MDSSFITQDSLGAFKSCSDTSNSSGNSVTSTRDTSPDLPHDSLSKPKHLKANYSNNITPFAEMERNLFHSGSEHIHPANTNVEGDDRTTTLGRGFRSPTSVVSAGGSLSTNWRGHPAPSNTFGLAIDLPAGEDHMLPSPTTPPGINRYSHFGATEMGIMLNKASDTMVSDNEMDRYYGYCYDRGNGQYTRLVPVDMLPPLEDILPIQRDCSGLIILPTPRMPEPTGHSINNQRPQVVVTSVPPQPQSDPIQSHIDTIIARSPPPNNSASKKTKIYCDKWIHDGTCAFTQQGCKYKHEMPTDKETQEKLGLFHGYPAWWKKLQADKQRPINDQSDGPVALSASAGRGGRPHAPGGPQYATSWRRTEPVHLDIPASPPPARAPFYSKGTVRGTLSAGRGSGKLTSPFGPIAPPARLDQDPKQVVLLPHSAPLSSTPRTTFPAQSNPYALLSSLDPLDNDPEDEEPEKGVTFN